MGNDMKKDPILRAVVVIFAGLLVFGFLFGANFGGMEASGQGMGGHHGAAASSGNPYFSGMFSGVLAFLVHTLFLVLIFSLIAGLIVGIRKLISRQEGILSSSKAAEYINQDPVLRTLVMVLAIIFGIYLISGLFGGGYGFSPYFMLVGLIGFVVKLLMLTLIISLVIMFIQYLKTQCSADGQQPGQGVKPVASLQEPSSSTNLNVKPNEEKDKNK